MNADKKEEEDAVEKLVDDLKAEGGITTEFKAIDLKSIKMESLEDPKLI